MRALTLIALLAATTAAGEVRLAAMGFTTRGVPSELGVAYAERFAAALRKSGIAVTTEKDLASVVSLERQRQLLGCADQSASCLAELAGALGAPYVATGSVSKVGNKVALSVRVLEVQKSRAIYTLSTELGSVEQVLDALEAAAPDAAEKLFGANPGHGSAPAGLAGTPSREPSSTGPWLVVALGAVAAGVGTGMLVAAQLFAQILYGAPQEDFGPTQAVALAEKTTTARLAGGVALGAGAAVMVLGVVWRLAQGSGPAVALLPSSGGAALAVAGEW